MDDLCFYVLFNSIAVISGRWTDDNERLYAMEPRLRLRRFGLERGSNSRRNLLNRKRGSVAHSLSLSSVHRPDMTGNIKTTYQTVL